MKFEVRFTEGAREDLLRLHELLSEEAPEAARSALATLERALTLLEEFPWSCRAARAMPSTRFRELIIPFGRRGYVALFEIEPRHVTILALRHQRESDFH